MNGFPEPISKAANCLNPYRRPIAVGLSLLMLSITMTARSHANGWEHGAIPFEALVKALDFEAPDMRLRAAQSLGVRGQPEAVPPLLQCLVKPERNHRVRSAVYTALGKLGDHRGIPALGDCLAEEAREEIRSDCVTALGMIGEKSTLPIILTVLNEDSSFLVQSSAVDALGSFSEAPAVQRLTALVSGNGNRTLRQRAIRALGQTGSPAAVKPLLGALSESRSDSERMLIVGALTDLRSTDAAQPLTKLLNKTGDPQLRTRIVIALGAIQDGSTYPVLIEMLRDEVPAVRYFAVRSLHALGRRDAALPISRLSLEISRRLGNQSTSDLLSDPLPALADLSLQATALQAIADLDAVAGREALLQAARSRSIPRESATALKLAEGFYQKRRAALYGLGYSESEAAARLLAGPAGVGDPDFRLRAVAVRSVGVLGDPQSINVLILGLDDPAAEVRWAAAAVLGRWQNPQAVAPLLERLSDKNSEVRRQAALSLGYLGDLSALKALENLLEQEENEGVLTAASYSIRLLRDAK